MKPYYAFLLLLATGQTAGAQPVSGVSITGNITTGGGHVLLKPEFRVDSYTKNKFINGDGTLTKSQATLGMAAIFKF